MRDCPKCTAPLADTAICCNACGWQKPGTRAASAPLSTVDDRDRWLCIDEYEGQRCSKLGVYSTSTQGGDRWYCFDHYPPFRAWRSGQRSAPSQQFRQITANLGKSKPIGRLVRSEAERIADDEADIERAAIQAESA